MYKATRIIIQPKERKLTIPTHRLVWHERLDNETLELASGLADHLVLVDALGYPLLALAEIGVHLDQAQLAPALDQLIGLDDETLGAQPGILGDEV